MAQLKKAVKDELEKILNKQIKDLSLKIDTNRSKINILSDESKALKQVRNETCRMLSKLTQQEKKETVK